MYDTQFTVAGDSESIDLKGTMMEFGLDLMLGIKINNFTPALRFAYGIANSSDEYQSANNNGNNFTTKYDNFGNAMNLSFELDYKMMKLLHIFTDYTYNTYSMTQEQTPQAEYSISGHSFHLGIRAVF